MTHDLKDFNYYSFIVEFDKVDDVLSIVKKNQVLKEN